MSLKPSDIAEKVIRDFERLAGSRGNFESQWTEIAERINPNGSHVFSPHAAPGSKGDNRTGQILDPTAAIALNRFAAIMDSLLTPRTQMWHKLSTNNEYLSKNREVNLYFEEVNRILFRYRYHPKANFASQNQRNYKSLGGYGTGCIFSDQLVGEPGVRYRAIHLGEIYFDENHQGSVDKAIRNFPFTARQAVQRWGKEALPESIVKELERNPEREFRFLHYVAPRMDDYDPSRFDAKGKPYVSYYVSMEGKQLIEEGGYNTFPYAVSRYEQADGEIYGRSPAMEVLPAMKTLNEQKRVLLEQGHRAVRPTLLIHDDGVLMNMAPGAQNFGAMTADGRPLVGTLPVGNVNIGKDMMDIERMHINDAFLVTLFQILMETPQMTATEVIERTKEKGILLAPTIGRQQTEYLGPMIERDIDLLSMQGLLPPMPGILREAKGEYTIGYDSPLTQAQLAGEAAGFMRTIETALSVVNVTQDPSVLDFFDMDAALPEIAKINGMPSRWVKSTKDVAMIRSGRAAAQQQQVDIQAAPAAAAMMKVAQGK